MLPRLVAFAVVLSEEHRLLDEKLPPACNPCVSAMRPEPNHSDYFTVHRVFRVIRCMIINVEVNF